MMPATECDPLEQRVTTACCVCTEQFDPSDWRFIHVTKKWSWDKHPRTHGARTVAKRCGFSGMLCAKCAGLLSQYLAAKDLEPCEFSGNLWLAARLGTVARNAASPPNRSRDAARKREQRAAAKERVSELEDALEKFVWEMCPYDDEGVPYSDEFSEEANGDTSWHPLHNELLNLCRRHCLASRYNDQEWSPVMEWDEYLEECEIAQWLE